MNGISKMRNCFRAQTGHADPPATTVCLSEKPLDKASVLPRRQKYQVNCFSHYKMQIIIIGNRLVEINSRRKMSTEYSKDAK